MDPAPEPFGMFGRCPTDRTANFILGLAFSHFGSQSPKRIDGGTTTGPATANAVASPTTSSPDSQSDRLVRKEIMSDSDQRRAMQRKLAD